MHEYKSSKPIQFWHTQHRDESSEGVDVERQGAGEEGTDTDQPQTIYEQTPRYHPEHRHPADLTNLRTLYA